MSDNPLLLSVLLPSIQMFQGNLNLSFIQVFATDEDDGDNGLVLYEINRRQSDPDRYFVMDVKSGVITLNRPLDYELKRVHELVVQARDNASQPEVIALWLFIRYTLDFTLNFYVTTKKGFTSYSIDSSENSSALRRSPLL